QPDVSISALAAYGAERLVESNRTDHKTAGNGSGNGMMPATQSSPPLSGAEAADLLERINELSEEEIERHLSELAPEGRA
ncbi:MAG TPA: hypothetical protein VE665_02935, partial [Hyphomicrobiaceae bacterium]|nr:hypothetical protein [Hyphomicrobiaceae bacterium]